MYVRDSSLKCKRMYRNENLLTGLRPFCSHGIFAMPSCKERYLKVDHSYFSVCSLIILTLIFADIKSRKWLSKEF
jgi:hypothetical protein